MTIVITGCTTRKRQPVTADLHAGRLAPAPLCALAHSWRTRIHASKVRYPARHLYGGRNFQESVAVADQHAAPLFIVSAGLGLVQSETLIPAYSCTVIPGTDDDVLARVTDSSSALDWWNVIGASSGLSCRLADVLSADDGLVLTALSRVYLELLAPQIERLPHSARSRFRLLTRAPLSGISPSLRPMVMPYDDRLDGPQSSVRGTRSDFASRALRHFAEHILRKDDQRDANEHAAAVTSVIAYWEYPEKQERARHDDPTLRRLIAQHWDALGGSSTKLLPFFRRELNISCEQGRFAGLVQQVRSARS